MAAQTDASDTGGLGFDSLIDELRTLASEFPDQRTGRNTCYIMAGVGLAAFSVFWTQSPSFLVHQARMAQALGQSNAETLFAMTEIPSDNHIRALLDYVPPEAVFALFDRIEARLRAQGHLAAYRVVDGQLLMALDGTQCHSSQEIHCDQCTRREHRSGQVSYAHTLVTPVIVAPGRKQVIALAPESVIPRMAMTSRTQNMPRPSVGWPGAVRRIAPIESRCSATICTPTSCRTRRRRPHPLENRE